jgi:hypothetical protein
MSPSRKPFDPLRHPKIRSIPEQIAWRSVPRKSFPELLGGPLGGRMSRYVEMDDTAALVSQYQEHVEDLETDRRYSEEVDRHHMGARVLRTPVRSPQVNAICERWSACCVGSVSISSSRWRAASKASSAELGYALQPRQGPPEPRAWGSSAASAVSAGEPPSPSLAD